MGVMVVGCSLSVEMDAACLGQRAQIDLGGLWLKITQLLREVLVQIPEELQMLHFLTHLKLIKFLIARPNIPWIQKSSHKKVSTISSSVSF